MKSNAVFLLALSLSVYLLHHNHVSTAFQPIAPSRQKMRTAEEGNRILTTRLQSSIHWPWHHDGIPKQDSHLLHEGVTAKFMPKWPAIVTYTLVKGWTDEMTQAFQEAVEKVVESNPILTGRVYRHRPFPIFHPRGDHFELRVDMGYYSQDNHDFVTVIDKRDEEIPADMNCTAGLNLMERQIIPSLGIHCESTGTEIRKKLPLFGAHVVRLPDDKACVAIKMSHCLGDGLTYYHVLDQILYYLNAHYDDKKTKRPPPIDWNHPLKATHECYPETFSEQDIRNSYGRPFFIGLFRNFRRLIDPSYSKLMVMRRDKIQATKSKYLDKFPEGTIISANDLITAGLCQSNDSTDIFSFPLNMRGRKEHLDDPMAAGYLCCEIPFPKKAALEPIGMRHIVTKKHFYETDQVPMEPFLHGRAGRMTNFASISSGHLFQKGASGFETVAHCLPSSFFEIFPIDVCVIYQLDKQHLGVIHNFEDYHENKLLDSMTVFCLEPRKEAETGK